MSETRTQKNALSEFVGVSATETPKYLVMNNFLLKYFKSDNSFQYEKIINWENDLFLCEEGNEKTRKLLKKSFKDYFSVYTGKNIMSKTNNEIFFPIIPEMLSTNNQFGLRHLLYAMQMKSIKDPNDFTYIQDKLYNFLFRENESELYSILKYICGDHKEKDIKIFYLPYTEYDGKKEFGENYSKAFFTNIAKRFNEDLNCILENKDLLRMDFYKRIDFFSTFLVFYIIQYLLERTNEIDLSIRNLIFCKGSTSSTLQTGPLHKACLNNYSNIRARFPEIVKKQFIKSIKQFGANKFSISKEDPIIITAILNSGEEKEYELLDFLKEAGLITSLSTRKGRLIEVFRNIFFTDDEKNIIETQDSFIIKYFNVQKRMSGSNTTKISSMLPTTGKEINFIFPRSSARQKYFALAEEMAEFLVRLYFATKNTYYDYLDSFENWLKLRYNIYINIDDTLREYLQKINSGISVKDANLNEKAFIQNLTNINCLIKLSDSGYILILPDKKGDFKLL